MKNGDRVSRELRTVLRSGGLPKQKPNSSRPNLTLDLSKGVLGFASFNEHKFEKLSSSRGQRTPRNPKVLRPGNKENDPSAHNNTERTARSKDLLDSYRTARNLHNLSKEDIFKKLRREEPSEACSLASHLKQSKLLQRSLGYSSKADSRAYRLEREAVVSSIKKLERSADIAKKIDFSLNSMSQDGKKKCRSSVMMRSDLQESAHSRRGVNLDSTSKTVSSLKKALFGNQMDVFSRRHRAVEYIELAGGQFSGPDSNELVNKWRRKRQTTDNITESSIKPFGSLHEGTGLTGITVSDVSRVFATEEESQPTSYPDSTMMLFEDQRLSAFGPAAGQPSDKDPLTKLSNPTRAANLESMKTIKEAEEREEMMGYTSQKETLNGGYLQGSFQNLLDKYCGNRESVVILESEAKSSRFMKSTLLQEERRKFEEARELLEQERLENNLEEAELYLSSDPQDKQQVQVAPNAQFTASSSRRPASPGDPVQFEESSKRDQRWDSREPETRGLLEPLDQNSVLTRKERATASKPAEDGLLAKKDAALDAEIDKILRHLDRESQQAQQAYRRKQSSSAASRRLESIEDAGVLRRMVRELELENRERETELISMNMQVQDLSRLARVLVRKVRCVQSRAATKNLDFRG